MGQKVHPYGFRIGVTKGWQAKWFSERDYRQFVLEDLNIRRHIMERYPDAGIAAIEIDRSANQVSLTVRTARPGVIIGRGGQRVEELRTQLDNLSQKRVRLDIQEIRTPELEAQLVARSVADALQRRVAYRRAIKQTIQRTMQRGAGGIKITVGGRLGGAEIARTYTEREGRMPLHTLRADIDYGFAEARTTFGRIGVKAWIFKSEVVRYRGTRPSEAAAPVTLPA